MPLVNNRIVVEIILRYVPQVNNSIVVQIRVMYMPLVNNFPQCTLSVMGQVPAVAPIDLVS